MLANILKSRFLDANNDAVSLSVKLFNALRSKIESSVTPTEKKITTAELIDWFKLLYSDIRKPQSQVVKKIESAIEQLQKQESSGKIDIPYFQALLKSRELYHQIICK